GYRVRLAVDASLAKDGYRHDPYDALILDAGTVGVDAVRIFEEVLNEARHRGRLCLGILILSVDQSSWAKIVPPGNNVIAFVRPVTLGQLIHALREHVPTPRALANIGNGTVETSGLRRLRKAAYPIGLPIRDMSIFISFHTSFFMCGARCGKR